jgi:ABC-type transporter MlaC component
MLAALQDGADHLGLELLKAKIFDPDDKVRAAACKVFSQLDYEGALHHVSEEQLRTVAGRGLDKKVRFPLIFKSHSSYIL